MSKVFEVAFKLGGELTSSFKSAIDQANKSFKGLEATGAAMQNVGKSLSMAVTAPIVGLGASVLKIGSDFDSQMSKVAAVSGAVGDDFDKLRAKAQELGSTTKFTATQAGEGLEFLSLAGYNTGQQLASIDGLLNLAAAANMELGKAADITTDVMSAFGMEADKAGHAADVFAFAQANANTNVEQMGEAMKYVAPMANQMGWSIEETAAAMMKLADNGLKGSIAGQAFASSVGRLSKLTPQAQKQVDKLGISFFDAQDNMKSIPDVIAELERGTAKLSMKQKTAALTTIFGAEAYKHWAILLESGSDTLATYTENLENSDGTAQRMADTMVDNLAGSLLMLRSAMEGVAIQLSDLVKGDIRALADKLTELTGKFAKLDDSTKKTIIVVAALAAALGPTLIVAGMLINSVVTLARAYRSVTIFIKSFNIVQRISTALLYAHRTAMLAYTFAGGGMAGVIAALRSGLAALNLAFLTSPVFLVVAGLIALAAAFYVAYKRSERFREVVDKVFESIKSAVLDTASFIASYASNMWNGIVESAKALPTRIKSAISQSAISKILSGLFSESGILDGLVESAKALPTRIKNAISQSAIGEMLSGLFSGDGIAGGLVESFKVGFSSLPNILSLLAPTMATVGLAFLGVSGPIGLLIGGVISVIGFLYRLSQTNEGVASALASAWSAVKTAFEPVIKVLSDGITEFAESVGPQLSETMTVISESISALAPSFAELGGTLGEVAVLLLTTWSTVGTTIATNVLPLLLQVFQTVFPLIVSVITTVVPIVINLLLSIVPIILQLVQMVIPLILSVVQMVFPMILSIIQSVLPIVAMLITTVVGIILMLAQTVLPLILSVVQMVFPIILSVIQAIIPIITMVLQTLVTVINGVIVPAINGILAVVQLVFPYVQMIIENALAIVNGIIQTAMALLQGDWDGAWNAIKTTAETIMTNIISFFQGINLFDVGKSIINGLIEGIASMGSAVMTAIGGLIPEPLKGAASKLLGALPGGKKGGIEPAMLAIGGIVSSPTLAWVGEGGDTESVIPWNNSQRSKDLWTQTGQALGMLGQGEKNESPITQAMTVAKDSINNVPVTNNVVNMMDYVQKMPTINVPETPDVTVNVAPAEVINLVEYVNASQRQNEILNDSSILEKMKYQIDMKSQATENSAISPEQISGTFNGSQNSNASTITLHYSPQYNVAKTDDLTELKQHANEDKDDLEARIAELMRNERRVSFGD